LRKLCGVLRLLRLENEEAVGLLGMPFPNGRIGRVALVTRVAQTPLQNVNLLNEVVLKTID
jgi:hypothetical protein